MIIDPKPHYLIEISEQQRTALLTLLRERAPDIEHEEHPLNLWIGMLEDMPTNQEADPDIVHSFCS